MSTTRCWVGRLLWAVIACATLAGRSTAQPAQTRQLVVVTTPGWDAVPGVLRRYERTAGDAPWVAVGEPIPVAVGRAGLAWGADTLRRSAREPRKREGDGRAPAGMFPLDTAFGFAAVSEVSWIRLPYVQLTDGSECVDDTASVHYNTVVDRARVPAVDWSSAERMRQIGQYRLGVIVGYNAPAPRAGRGSCIFLHIWGGPGVGTAGCTAFPPDAVETVARWLDASRRPGMAAERATPRPAPGGRPGAPSRARR